MFITAPKIIDTLTPYKDVDGSYVSNPVPFEKVRFTGEYIGETFSSSGGYFFPVDTSSYSVVKVDNQYVIIRDNDLGIIGTAKEGNIIQLEGKFSEGEKTTQPLNNKPVQGYWLAPDNYEIIS